MTMPNYRKTKIACYMGFITQAIAANFAPLLFLKFHNDYQIAPVSYTHLNCGHIVIGEKAPEVCPACNHPQSYFEIHAENY